MLPQVDPLVDREDPQPDLRAVVGAMIHAHVPPGIAATLTGDLLAGLGVSAVVGPSRWWWARLVPALGWEQVSWYAYHGSWRSGTRAPRCGVGMKVQVKRLMRWQAG